MAPYDPRNISPSNNYIRYGSSIWTSTPAKIPFINFDFGGFLGNALDEISKSSFASYWMTGNLPFVTHSNKDFAKGINIIYEDNADYTSVYNSAAVTQPPSSYFIIDSFNIYNEKNKTSMVYIQARFSATLTDPKDTTPINITHGNLKIMIDNSLKD